MKILHVLQQLPMKTGSGVYFSNLIDEFNKLGVENIALYAIESPYKADLNCKSYEVEFNTPKLPFPIPGMSDIMPYESTRFSDATRAMLDDYLAAFENRLTKIKEEHDFDMIFCHHLFLVTDLVRRLFPDKKIYAFSHGTDLRQVDRYPGFLKSLTAIKDLDHIFTVNPKNIDEIIKLFDIDRDKITNIGGGFNQNIFNDDYIKDGLEKNEKDDKDELKIIYAGKISPSKGVHALAMALPIIEEKYPNVKMHLIGVADDETKEELSREAEGSSNLLVYNSQTQESMAKILKEGDVFVLPSYFEALGLIAIEALACRKFVVTSDIEGLKNQLGEVVNNSGAIIYTKLPRIYDLDKPYEEDIKDYVERLAENIIAQLDKVVRGEIISDEIMKEIDKNSWQALAKKIYDMIN
ncbi:MAG: glycosyltransferase family 4 protein [Ezakiella sp.]|nr:glycosyltransferase family 4 protein [Bacillota bacterium]MDY3947496.1 glycosyltransferase family 4 protein [Ezakiella sp.]